MLASQVWAAVDRRLGIPLNATWAMTALAFLIGLPLLHSEETFFALASISSVGLNLSCEGPSSLHVQSHSFHRAHAGCADISALPVVPPSLLDSCEVSVPAHAWLPCSLALCVV